MKRFIRTSIILILLVSNISCDQASKNLARQSLAYNEHVQVISNYFVLIKVENTGAFLSLGHALPKPVKLILLIIFPLLALSFGTFYVLTQKKLTNTSLVGLSFIVGGGIGNIYDRVVYGSVTDFLHFDFGIFRTGIFNMADVSVLIGAFILVVELTRSSRTPDFEPVEKINSPTDSNE